MTDDEITEALAQYPAPWAFEYVNSGLHSEPIAIVSDAQERGILVSAAGANDHILLQLVVECVNEKHERLKVKEKAAAFMAKQRERLDVIDALVDSMFSGPNSPDSLQCKQRQEVKETQQWLAKNAD